MSGEQPPNYFFTYEMSNLGLSFKDDFANEYSVAGFSVTVDHHFTSLLVQPYDFFTLMDDCGGFLTAVIVLARFFYGGVYLEWTVFAVMPFFFYERKEKLKEDPKRRDKIYQALRQGRLLTSREQMELRAQVEADLNNRKPFTQSFCKRCV